MRSPAPSCPANDEEEFLREVRHELHALAQPLTLLQVRLEAALLCRGNASSDQTLLLALAADVQRACEHFGTVRDLIRRRGCRSLECVSFSAQDLVRSVHEALSPHFNTHGVELCYAAPAEQIWVSANRDDMRCSLLQGLLLVRSMLSTGLLTLSLRSDDTFALIELKACDWATLNAGAPTAVAEAITRLLETLGFAVVQDSCFKATMRLPKTPSLGTKALP